LEPETYFRATCFPGCPEIGFWFVLVETFGLHLAVLRGRSGTLRGFFGARGISLGCLGLSWVAPFKILESWMPFSDSMFTVCDACAQIVGPEFAPLDPEFAPLDPEFAPLDPEFASQSGVSNCCSHPPFHAPGANDVS
jgi:hypothetical protein